MNARWIAHRQRLQTLPTLPLTLEVGLRLRGAAQPCEANDSDRRNLPFPLRLLARAQCSRSSLKSRLSMTLVLFCSKMEFCMARDWYSLVIGGHLDNWF